MDPGAGNGHDRALLMATSARFHWPSPRGFVSAYAQNLMAADRRRRHYTSERDSTFKTARLGDRFRTIFRGRGPGPPVTGTFRAVP